MADFAPNTSLPVFAPCPLPPNPELNISNEIYQKMSQMINGPVSGVIVIHGIIANILCLAAFSSHIRPRPIIYHYLIALCFWDIALLVCAGLISNIPVLLLGRQIYSHLTLIIWWYYFAGVTLVGCVWTITVLSCDRYLSICHPFSYRLLKKKTIIKMMVIVAVSAVIYCCPRLLEMKIGTCNNSMTHELESDIQATWLKSHPAYLVVYKIAGGVLFVSLFPYLLLLSLSIRISTELRRAAKISSPATMTAEQRVDSSNKILMALIIKFLCCYLPITILDIWEAVVGEENFLNKPPVMFAVVSSNFLVALNSGTNFWVYITLSYLFRRACRRVLRGHCGAERYSLKAAGFQLAKMFDTHTALINGMMAKATTEYGTVVRRKSAVFLTKLSIRRSSRRPSNFPETDLQICDSFDLDL